MSIRPRPCPTLGFALSGLYGGLEPLDLGGYLPIGDFETFHHDHGDVDHAVSSLRLGFDVRWRGLYFGTEYLQARDRRHHPHRIRRRRPDQPARRARGAPATDFA